MTSARDRLLSGGTHKEVREVGFDETSTADFMTAMKLSLSDKQNIMEYAERRKRHRPRIADFRAVFPEFPVYVTVDRQENLRDTAGLKELFPASKALKQQFIRRFFALRSEMQFEIAGRPMAVLIRWPGMDRSVVLHQIPHDPDIPGVYFRFMLPTDPIERLTIEPLDQFRQLLQSLNVV
jgi:hypothetical protein